MSTTAGRLPCKRIIHTVGPKIGRKRGPTVAEASLLRRAVGSALVECARLGLASIAIPGISTGIFGYPVDLAAVEIVGECIRFCRLQPTTSVRTIVLMNVDAPTVHSFVKALQSVAEKEGASLRQPSVDGSTVAAPEPSVERADMSNTHDTKAAGVLCVRVSASGYEVLLGVEYRPMDSSPGQCVNFLGGKEDFGEQPLDTAAREFSEEVGMILSKNEVRTLLEDKERTRELHLQFAKYVLYITHSDSASMASLPDQYSKRKRRSMPLGGGAEHEYLLWASWRAVVSAVRSDSHSPSLVTPKGRVPLSAMLCRFVRDFGASAEFQLEQLLIDRAIHKEQTRIDKLKKMSNQKLLAELLQNDWKLNLKSPPPPPPPPIRTLASHDPEMNKVIQHLRPEDVPQVVSVRSVHTSARSGAFKNELTRLKAIPQAQVSEQMPLFHGTPERWRATAIALNGFDLNIKLVGRSHGDGVYASSSIEEARGYSHGTGSLLLVNAILTSKCPNPSENTVVPTATIHVFPNPKCVLPVWIVDFAASDRKDSVEMQRQHAQDEYTLVVQKRSELLASMKTQEAEFTRGMAKRLRAALRVYERSLDAFKADFADAKKSNSERNEDDAIGSELSARFFVERQQFARCLPIYEVKPELVQVLTENRVTILVAETGSGKSTQLPQILLDHILPVKETRRIAVLEPRRVNAISLSRRVADERGLPPGQEVGYTIGRGESNVTATTRIEFMTHGLFVQLARNRERLLEKYCAVVVDEAHERSVDVDLSMALLKRALNLLERNAKRGGGESPLFFRVVVTSATIGDEAAHFQQYLDPARDSSIVYRVHGRTFPVHVEHRDITVDRRAVGSAGVGKVLTSAAIQTAMDVLKSTDTGNVLIFLPGEGSINDALDLARQDILLASGGEELASQSLAPSQSSSFSFRLRVEQLEDGEADSDSNGDTNRSWTNRTGMFTRRKPKPTVRTITACILGFHGKMSRAETDQVLNPSTTDRRFVIFSTNVAETGVTLPNVRYVIDTGLERHVRWNAAADINEMVTEPVTASSMKQRAGRAGRTSSGICIRLYPEAETSESSDPENTLPGQRVSGPGVQSAMVYKAVLMDKHMQQLTDETLELLEPIDPTKLKLTEERLHELGALDESGILTREGEALLALGIDLRLGRFLMACNHFGCLETGTKLVSIIMSSDGAERLLPDRKCLDRAESIADYIDPSGDHITLLNLVEGFGVAQAKGQGMAWCQQHGWEGDVFIDAETSLEYLLKVLDGLKFSLADEDDRIQQYGGKHSCIRRALCAAYYDHLARPRSVGSTKHGFVRILDEAHGNGVVHMMADFAGRTQPTSDQDSSTTAATESDEPLVKAAGRTTLWLDTVAKQAADSDTVQLIVFGSMMLTDGSSSCVPSVQLLTFVTEDEVVSGAADWCRVVHFHGLLQTSAREEFRVPVDSNLRKTLLVDRGHWLKQIRHKFPTVVANLERDALKISCPRRIFPRVELHVNKLLRDVEPETVTLQLPGHVKISKIIGKEGRNITTLEQNIQALLSSEESGAGRHHVRNCRVLEVDGKTNEIRVKLRGASKALMPVIVGRIQSLIVETHGAAMLPLVKEASGERGQQMQQCPRLAQLVNSVPPSSWASRDDIMLQLAHAIVWRCNGKIYGGFVRDWVVRGESANDIDVRISPPQLTTASAENMLQQFLAQSQGAQQRGLRITRRGTKGSAWAVTIEGNGIQAIDVDLVDPAQIKQKMHPGVDCDAGNLMLTRANSLCKKVDTGDSLSSALEHVRNKQFVFFYALNTGVASHDAEALRRLRKYLSRGWVCLSKVPSAVLEQLLDAERQLVQPNGAN